MKILSVALLDRVHLFYYFKVFMYVCSYHEYISAHIVQDT